MINHKTVAAMGVFAVFVATLFIGVSNSWGHIPAGAIPASGRMTGGGSFFTGSPPAFQDYYAPPGTRITFGFELHCDVLETPNNLEVQVHLSNGNGGIFHLEKLTYVFCQDNPDINSKPPKAPFNTMYGQGVGNYNGVEGYCADWEFADAGEPSTNDWVHDLRIWFVSDLATVGCGGNASGTDANFLFSVNEPGHELLDGNYQAHKDNE